MSKKYISQAEIGEFCGCTQQYVGKLKKAGLFDHLLDNNKFPRNRSTEIAKVIEDNKDETREPQRQANEIKKNGGEISHGKKDNKTPIAKNNFGMFDVSYLGGDAQMELEELTDTGKSAVQKIQIKDAFIESKRKENEFKKELGVLIDVEEAQALMELILSNMKTKMYNVPHLTKAKYSRTTKEQVDFMYMLIDEAFAEFHKYGLDDVKVDDEL